MSGQEVLASLKYINCLLECKTAQYKIYSQTVFIFHVRRLYFITNRRGISWTGAIFQSEPQVEARMPASLSDTFHQKLHTSGTLP